jgi:outer membrane biosynthesis protein TonB
MSSPPSSPPSSRRPAGVPESGNAKYAVVAVVLLLGAGGLYAWRSASNRVEPPAPIPSAPVADASSPTNSKLEDIPPPPPAEEVPEAAPPPKVVYVPAGGCEAKCAGTAPPELEQALQVRGSQARRCYNTALAQDSSLKGHVTIAVKIGPSGNVCSANVLANDMGSPTVAACAAGIFRSNSNYPAPHGGCVEADVPLSFVPQGQ